MTADIPFRRELEFEYGVIEDVHQSLMHILAQHIRQAHMDEAVIGQRKF